MKPPAEFSASAFLLTLFLASAVAAQTQREILEGPGASVAFSPGQKHFAESTLSMYARAIVGLEKRLGLSPRRNVSIVLTRTQAEFRDVTGGSTESWIAALAYPSEDLIIIDGSKIEIIGMNDLITTLSHELTHILLGQIVQRRDELPMWFNEGVAMWASSPHFPTPREELVIAARGDALLHYSDLTHSFPSSRNEIDLAYAESHEFISYLEQQFGQGTVRAVIAEMEGGAPVADALLRVTRHPLGELWEQWTLSLRERSGLLAAVKLISRFGIPLFAVVALAVVLGYVRYLLVKRRKMKRWQEEERMGYW